MEQIITPQDSTQQLISLIKYLKRKKIFIAVMAIIGLSLGLIYSFIKKPIYTASITFSLQEETKVGGGGLLSLASSFGLDMGGAGGLFSGDNIEQVFKSRKILEKTLFQQYPNNAKTYGDCLLDIQGIRKKMDLPYNIITRGNNNVRLKDSLIAVIHKYLEAGYLDISKPDKKYDIYEIIFKGTDENFSKMFVQELVNQVALFYTETKTKKAKQNVEVLQNRVDSIHNALGSSLYKRAEASIMSLNPAFQTGKVAEQFKNIDVTALGAGYGELLKNLELAKYTLLKETPLFQIIDEAKFPLKKKTFSPIFYSLFGTVFMIFFSISFLVFIKLVSRFNKLLVS